MFARGELILCGTSTTGTGTLTLAATPVPPGGVDPVAAWGTSGAFPVAYVIREYTDSTFGTLKQAEKGYGTLTLNASLTSATLSRSPSITATSLNSQPATYNNLTATALTIGTAANVLVEIGPCAAEDIPQTLPDGFFSTSGITNSDGLGISGVTGAQPAGTNFGFTTGQTVFVRTQLDTGIRIKSVTLRIQTAITTPTTNSLAAALFEVSSAGLPGKRLISFGTSSGTTGAPLGAAGNVTITAAAAVYIPAGVYITGFLPVWTGGTGSPATRVGLSVAISPFGTFMSSFCGPVGMITVASGDLNDPPTTTGAAIYNNPYEMMPVFRST